MVKYVGQQTVTPVDFGNGAVYWTHFSRAGGTEQSLIWVNGGGVGKRVGSSERKSGQRGKRVPQQEGAHPLLFP